MKRGSYLLEGLFALIIMGGVWLGFNQINWMQLFGVKEMTDKTEQKLGDLLWDFQRRTGEILDDEPGKEALDSLVWRICEKNKLDSSHFKVHLFNTGDVNAFAMPGGHLVVFTGLLQKTENASELAGVLAHEMAHIENNHVMNKLLKEFGLAVLVSMAGGSGGQQVAEVLRMLSSSAFDRSLEKEADEYAVHYLEKARINPESFAVFMDEMAKEEPDELKHFRWITTHPDSKERAQNIRAHIRSKKRSYQEPLSESLWQDLKALGE